jgi:alpha-mannosidase
MTSRAARPENEAHRGDWRVDERGAENRHLAFAIAPDGGLEVTDKTTGQVYHGLGHISDVEDAGDEYSYCPCPVSETISTAGVPAAVSCIANGAVQATFRVAWTLRVPEGLRPDRQRRARKRVSLPIVSEITLTRDQPGLTISTQVENTARDHKLSVIFPTGLNPEVASVDEAFAVMERDLDLPEATGWVEDPTPMMHQRAFTDLSQDGRGLMVLNRGLPAVEVTRGPGGAQIVLTLLRSVGWLSRDDLATRRVAGGPLVPTPDAQCPGAHRFEYAIAPHAGDWRAAYPIAHNYLAPLLVARADTHEGLELREMNITRDDPAQVVPIPWPRGGSLPDALSFLTIEPQELILSAVRRCEDGLGLVVRFYNVSREPVTACLTSGLPLQSARRLNLNEEPGPALDVRDGHRVDLPVRGAEVVTCELRPLRG